MTKREELAFTAAELNERNLFKKWALKMDITEYIMSPIGSKNRWDVAYKLKDQWYISDIKASNIPSDKLYPTATNNGIDGHLIKKGKFEGLYEFSMTKCKIAYDEYYGIVTEYKQCFRPVFQIFFNDGIVATWNLDKLGILWDNINSSIIEEDNFITIWDKKTTMGSTEMVQNRYYKPGLKLKDAHIIKI